MGKRQKEQNMLTMIPVLEQNVHYHEAEGEKGFLAIDRTSFFEKLSIRFLKQPAVRKIQLDKFGAFAVGQFQDAVTVEEISAEMQRHFGEEAEPALPRLVKFLQILEAHEWISWKEKKE